MRRTISICLLAVCLLAALLSGCVRSNDGPPDPGTPEPAPLNGTYTGEGLTLTFNGDGKSVTVTGSEVLDPGDYEYVFLFDSFGTCRRDVANVLRFMQGEKTYQFRLTPTAEDRLEFAYDAPDGATYEYRLLPG